MKKQQPSYDLYILKKAVFTGNCIGFALFLFSLIENGLSYSIILSFIGLGIMIASMITFGFGMCLNLMAETSDKSKGKNTSPCQENNPYYFLEKQRYYYK